VRSLPLLVLLTAAVACHRAAPAPQPSPAAPFKLTPGFVLIRAGTFVMGSAPDEPNRYTNEQQHEVTLTHDYELAATEVTQKQFAELLGYNPSRFRDCPSCPVETVTWHEAAAYTNALSARAGLTACYTCMGSGAGVSCEVAKEFAGAAIYTCPGYRLPIDAEWEHAYRAGTKTPLYNGTGEARLRATCTEKDATLDEIGWYCANSDKRSHPVGQKKPNPWGLYDLSGNVWEWCHDKYVAVLGAAKATDPWGIASSSVNVVRGGSWEYFGRGMRAATRGWYRPGYRGDHHGLRVARTAR